MTEQERQQLAREVARQQALPGTSKAEMEARAEQLARVLEGDALLPVARHVQTQRQEDDGDTAPNGEPFHVRIKASTEGLARDGGLIPLEAWEDGGLANYRKNPVVMLSHGHGFPLGMSVHDELDTDARALVSWWRFHEENEESRLARRLYETGFMRAASVGFRILDWHEPDEEEREALREEHGISESEEIWWVADRAELLEESAVGVPADPDSLTSQSWGRAMKNARAHGIDVDPLEARIAKLEAACEGGDEKACRKLSELDGPTDRKAEGEEREAISFSRAHEAGSYEVADRDAEWDAGAELEEMEASEDVLLPRHALRDDDADPDTKTAYSFPHHRAGSGMAVVFRALAAGFARLDQADATESEKDGVAEHLGRHYRADYDEEPPEREAVAAAVRAWPRRGTDEDDEEADVGKYVEEHGETLEKVGGGDVAVGAEAVAEAARQRDEADAGEEQREEEEPTDGDDAGGTGEPATGDEGTEHDAEPDASADAATDEETDEEPEGEHEAESTEERLEGLEEAVSGLQESVSGLRETVEQLQVREEPASADAEEADADGGEEADAGADEDEDDGRGLEMFDADELEVQTDEDGTRYIEVEMPGGEMKEVELAEGQEPRDLLEQIEERAMRKLRGAPIPRGGGEEE